MYGRLFLLSCACMLSRCGAQVEDLVVTDLRIVDLDKGETAPEGYTQLSMTSGSMH